jgi:bifunctional NMN adenylyltransferase/nudix hydrolase
MPQMHKYPTSFQATDVVVIDRQGGRILLGRKPKQPAWRVMGGFVDPADQSLEMSAARELQEEGGINLECTPPKYLFSFRVPDPRYIGEQDKIMSAVFLRFYLWGIPKAGDDIKSVKWFTKDYVRRNYKNMIMPEHYPLIEELILQGYL